MFELDIKAHWQGGGGIHWCKLRSFFVMGTAEPIPYLNLPVAQVPSALTSATKEASAAREAKKDLIVRCVVMMREGLGKTIRTFALISGSNRRGVRKSSDLAPDKVLKVELLII